MNNQNWSRRINSDVHSIETDSRKVALFANVADKADDVDGHLTKGKSD